MQGKKVKVACVSLGGTKIQIGVIRDNLEFTSVPELAWRNRREFSNCRTAKEFCDALVAYINHCLRGLGSSLEDVEIFGFPFPGPRKGNLLFSNNLLPAFEDGVPLEEEIKASLQNLFDDPMATPSVRIMFDANCDAGGEIYHPRGRLYGCQETKAVILNIASGIAAGFAIGNRLLLSDQDFHEFVNASYDSGAGQLGRHLWYYPQTREWKYYYRKGGETPDIPAPAVRMTERLSGPSLASRILRILGGKDLIQTSLLGISQEVCQNWKRVYAEIAKDIGNEVRASKILRKETLEIAKEILKVADRIYFSETPTPIYECIYRFFEEVVQELSDALNLWSQELGWGQFSNRIVLTGGIGIHLFARSDANKEKSFVHALNQRLPRNCHLERSQLLDATEREAYVFLHC